MADTALRTAGDPRLEQNEPAAKFEWSTVAQALVVACAVPGQHALRVASEERSGTVFIESQHVVHAEYGDQTGLIALIEMLKAGRVRIRTWDDGVPLRRTLRIGAEALLTGSMAPSRPPPLPDGEWLRLPAQHRAAFEAQEHAVREAVIGQPELTVAQHGDDERTTFWRRSGHQLTPPTPTGAGAPHAARPANQPTGDRPVGLSGTRLSGVFQKVPAPRFTGPLPELSLADLLQIIQWMGRSAVISITHAGVDSHVWCDSGEIIDAHSGRLHAEAALYRTLNFDKGWLIGELRSVQRHRTIFAATQRILLEAARRKDVSQRLRRALGDEHRPFRFPAKRIPAGLGPEELELLQSFATGRTPYAAMQVSELGDFETLKLLARWVQKGDLLPIGRNARSAE